MPGNQMENLLYQYKPKLEDARTVDQNNERNN